MVSWQQCEHFKTSRGLGHFYPRCELESLTKRQVWKATSPENETLNLRVVGWSPMLGAEEPLRVYYRIGLPISLPLTMCPVCAMAGGTKPVWCDKNEKLTLQSFSKLTLLTLST